MTAATVSDDLQPQLSMEHISGLNFANFNQDYTCISVGYNNGFRVYNCEPFAQCYQQVDGAIGIVEMLFFSSLLAVVGTGENPALSPRRLRIINTKRHTTICELTFPTSILAVRMNRHRLIVMLEELIYIYDITNMRLLHTVEIPSNPTGLVALSIDTSKNYLAYPSPKKVARIGGGGGGMNDVGGPFPGASINTTGDLGHGQGGENNGNGLGGDIGDNGFHDLSVTGTRVKGNDEMVGEGHTTQNIRNGDIIIFDCESLQPITVIDAHKTELAAMAFSHDGTLLATASDKGTVIRVFSVETGLKLYQFRRGTYNTKIYSLAFSPSNMFLVASSATGTVHVFRLGEEEAKNTIVRSKGSSGWLVQKKNATDRNIEATRQEELDKLMKNRQAKLDNLDGEFGDQYHHDQMHEYINSQNGSGEQTRSHSSEGDTMGLRGSMNFDSEEEEEEEDDDDDEEGRGDSISDDDDIADGQDYENIDVLQPLRSDIEGSAHSKTGAISIASNSSGGTNASGKVQPVVDSSRRSVARMLRRTSQSLGRKAAEKMGTYLPPRFSSLLEPNRHFASFKVPGSKENMSLVGVLESSADAIATAGEDGSFVEPGVAVTEDGVSVHSAATSAVSSAAAVAAGTVHILVVSAEGVLYTYGLDPQRGGDCVQLAQRSLQE